MHTSSENKPQGTDESVDWAFCVQRYYVSNVEKTVGAHLCHDWHLSTIQGAPAKNMEHLGHLPAYKVHVNSALFKLYICLLLNILKKLIANVIRLKLATAKVFKVS